ncbi:MAG: sugar ABC transporter ATP-binding protein [Propionibacteriaceae bacterium]|jgi:ribose transport system ATP-binding protein|nr:sugar ABC transporter ATP-binding protein [Propionibacteriaceae bacterium]
MTGVPLLEARSVSKSFPGVQALNNVDFSLQPGQIHALVGENGAGKSTLMKIFAGLDKPDGGELLARGQAVAISTPAEAREQGISVIHQEFFLMNHLTVAQNIFIGREPKLPGGFLIDDGALNRQARELLERLSVEIDPTTPVSKLSVARQQLVEIAKALAFDAQILIMDEPTAALGGNEVETLFRIIRDFASRQTGVVYISHRMEEIKEIATHITVLRDGQVVASEPAARLPIPKVIQLMVGREVRSVKRLPVPGLVGASVLDVEHLSAGALVKDVSFSLKRGEILGFAGLMGAGRTETVRALVGADPKTEGVIRLKGEQVRISSPADAVRLGIGYLSEDRKRFGLILRQSVKDNIVLPSLARFSFRGIIWDSKANAVSARYLEVLDIKTPSLKQPVRFLSGGNQQKVVLAKWLERNCDILIFDEPTRGIDVGAKQEIYELMRDLVAAGKSIILISSELDEVLQLADRTVVMCDGRVTGTLGSLQATPEKIMELATQFHDLIPSKGEAHGR